MARKKKKPTYTEEPSTDTKVDRLDAWKKEYTRWLSVLETYHTERFAKNYEQYTALPMTQGTISKISDPVAPELVERKLQKLFERDPKFYAMARGQNIPKEITDFIANIASYYWTNPEKIQSTGTMRAFLKKVGREFAIVGNAGTEVYFNAESDNPDVRQIPIEDIIFDPARPLKNAPVYYIRQYMSLEDIEGQVEVTEEGKVTKGLFKKDAVSRLRTKYEERTSPSKNDPTPNQVNRTGSTVFDRPVDDVLIVSRWEGDKLCQIADWEEIIREVEDPVQIEDDPLDFIMDIEVNKVPYAFSMLDFIAGLTAAKDMFLNQVIDYGSKALNPPLFYDPALSPASRLTLRNAYALGGLVAAAPNQAGHQPMPDLPQAGFSLLTYMQQRSESVVGVGPYVSGVPNQSSDQTQGTKGGIEALIQQASSPIRDMQLTIEEGIIEPIVNKWLKMGGALMGDNEIKYIMVSGQDPKWVKVTKGLLTGKIKLEDLATAGLIEPEEEMQLRADMAAAGKNPDKELMFDVDWIIRCETGSLAEVDTQKDMQNFMGWAKFAMEASQAAAANPNSLVDVEKIIKEAGLRGGVKEPEQYLKQAQPMQMPPQAMPQAAPAGPVPVGPGLPQVVPQLPPPPLG